MKTELANLWEKLHTSFWFVPTLMVGLTILAAWSLLWLDTAVIIAGRLHEAPGFSLLYNGKIEGARELLSSIASSVITIAGVTFSITIVVLSLASSEYGPLVLRNYIRSIGSQLVMSTFVSTFIYCLLVLQNIESNGPRKNGFHLSVTFAVLLGLASIYALIYFIHHTAESIQAAFHQISYYCGRQEAVLSKLEMTIESIIAQTEDESRRNVLNRMLRTVQSEGGKS